MLCRPAALGTAAVALRLFDVGLFLSDLGSDVGQGADQSASLFFNRRWVRPIAPSSEFFRTPSAAALNLGYRRSQSENIHVLMPSFLAASVKQALLRRQLDHAYPF